MLWKNWENYRNKEKSNTSSKLCKKKKFRHIKTGQIPSKADPAKQKEFLENELEPKLKEAKNGKRKVLFVDAAHFVMGAYLTCFWCLARIFVPTSSGRQRYNVLGAIDVYNQDLITVTNDSYINSDCLCELLLKTKNLYSSLAIPITLVLDNAKYQRCQKVTDYAKDIGIELLFLPTYSPNLNLIERLWKFTKKKCLYGKHHKKFANFKESIDRCLSKVGKEYKEDISTLITTNFQHFEDLKGANQLEKAS